MRLSQAPCRHPMVLYDWPAEVLKPRGSTVLPGMALCTSEGETGQHEGEQTEDIYLPSTGCCTISDKATEAQELSVK